MLTYVLFAVIVLLIALIGYILHSGSRERERLNDRLMAKTLAEYKAFDSPHLPTPKNPDKQAKIEQNTNDVIDAVEADSKNDISSEALVAAQNAYSTLIR